MNSYRFRSFEITIREIIVSVTIIAVMLILGLVISNKMTQARVDRNERYNKAIKIESSEIFQYGMRTNVGDAFVSGVLSPVDTVNYSDVDGEYLYLRKIKERYTKHTRRVAHTTGKTTYYTTETYWTWDYAGEESIHADKIQFCDVIFDYGKIDYKDDEYVDTVKESYYIRYIYYGIPATNYSGTIFTNLKDGTISDNSPFYKDRNAQEAYEYVLLKDFSIVFWIIWVALMIGLVVAFYYADNKWLY